MRGCTWNWKHSMFRWIWIFGEPWNDTSCGLASVIVRGLLSTLTPVLARWRSGRFSSDNKPESSGSCTFLHSYLAISVLSIASPTSYSASSFLIPTNSRRGVSGRTSCFRFVILRNFVTEFLSRSNLYEVFLGSFLAAGGFGASFIHMIATCGQFF